MSSAASRKALGEALDGQVADLRKDESKAKNSSSNGNRGANRNQNKQKATGQTEAKQLQKDIKAFLVCV